MLGHFFERSALYFGPSVCIPVLVRGILPILLGRFECESIGSDFLNRASAILALFRHGNGDASIKSCRHPRGRDLEAGESFALTMSFTSRRKIQNEFGAGACMASWRAFFTVRLTNAFSAFVSVQGV